MKQSGQESKKEKLDKRTIVMRIVVWVLILMLVCSVAFPAIINAKYTQGDVDRLEDKMDGLDSKKNQYESNIKEGKQTVSQQMARKTDLENQVERLNAEIDQSNGGISTLEAAIAQKEAEIARAGAEYDEEYAYYKKRVKQTYEEGSVSYLNVLLESDTFADMLTRADFVAMMIEQDQKTMDHLSRLQQNLKEKKDQIEADKSNQDSLKAQLIAKRTSVTQKAKECQSIADSIAADVDKNKQMLMEAEKYEAELEAEIKRILKEIAKQNMVYVGGEYAWPLDGYYRISSQFGYRMHPTLHVKKLHTGIDIAAPNGTEIHAANSGTVITSTMSTAWGNYVMINHGGGQVTLYAHMSKRLVSKGDKVQKGETIGKVGSTGYSTGNHLHFEIRINGDYVNPMNYFKKG